jgi:hypothetical protein
MGNTAVGGRHHSTHNPPDDENQLEYVRLPALGHDNNTPEYILDFTQLCVLCFLSRHLKENILAQIKAATPGLQRLDRSVLKLRLVISYRYVHI